MQRVHQGSRRIRKWKTLLIFCAHSKRLQIIKELGKHIGGLSTECLQQNLVTYRIVQDDWNKQTKKLNGTLGKEK